MKKFTFLNNKNTYTIPILLDVFNYKGHRLGFVIESDMEFDVVYWLTYEIISAYLYNDTLDILNQIELIINEIDANNCKVIQYFHNGPR